MPTLLLRRQSHIAALVLSATIATMPATSKADSFSQSLNVSSGVLYNSNPLFSVTSNQPVWIATLSPNYSISTITGLNKWSIDAGLNVQRSSDTFIMVNRNDPTAALGWVRTLQSGTISVKAHYEQDSTLFGVGQMGNSLIAQDGTRNFQSLTADWLDNLNDTWQLDNNVSDNYVTYSFNNSGSGNVASFLSNYQTDTYSSKLIKAFSNTISGYGQISYTQFTLTSQPVSDTQLSTILGLQSQLSETLNLSADAGATNTSGSGFSVPGSAATSSNSTGFIGNILLTYQGLRSSASLKAARTSMPSGFGGFLLSDEIDGQYSHALSDNNSIGTEYTYLKSLSLFIDTSSQFSLWFSHQISPTLGLKLMLQQREFSTPGFPGANDNTASLFLTYNNPDF